MSKGNIPRSLAVVNVGKPGIFPDYALKWANQNVDNMDEQHSQIRGNVSGDMKRACLAVFLFFVSTQGNSYGAEVGGRIKVVEMNVWEGSDVLNGPKMREKTHAEVVFEVVVDRDMCNILGTLHGACAAYIVDPCSVAPLVLLGITAGVDGTGVSQSMNLIWHEAAKLGRKLRIVASTVSIKGRVRTARCELWDEEILCVSAVHSTVNPSRKSFKDSEIKANL